MQTIANLANRLDMSAEEAVETLRKLHYDVADVEAVIDNEQTDILISIDEDASVLDTYLEKILKKEEEKRKRTERLQKAAAKKKPAAKKPAAKKPAAKKKATGDEAEILEDTEEEVLTAEHETLTEEVAEETEPEPEAEVLPEIPATVEVAEPVEAAEAVETLEIPEPPAAPVPPAPPAPRPHARETAHPEEAPVVRRAEILTDDVPVKPAEEKAEHRHHGGALAEAQRAQDEHAKAVEQRPKKPERPMPTPDPEVVAAVIRRDQERRREKAAAANRANRPASQAPTGTNLAERMMTLPDDEMGRAGLSAKKKTGKTAKKKQKRAERARVLEDTMRRDAAAAVREFQAGGLPGSMKKKKRKSRSDMPLEFEEEIGGVIEVEDHLTVEALALAMEVGVNDLILELMEDNILVNKNQNLDLPTIRRLAEKYNYEVRTVIPEEEDVMAEEPDNPEDLKSRAPVVTVMGHVDHGKTSLLDIVRRANVAAGEAGGITQHIAAYEVQMAEGRVVFLDTPGHEAFTHMRARGAHITDVVVLVVAADDGVKPQTVEAIDHAKAAEVPIVVAVNKCDKPGAQPDRVRQELTQYGLLDEAWGGKTIMRNISAKTGEGVDELMELLVLESQMLELKANPNKRARGAVIESELTRGQGPVAWVLVQSGTLRVGDAFLAGETFGRVRTITSSRGENLQEAGPATPVLITGFNETANAGDVFVVGADERVVRGIAEKRASINRAKRGAGAKHMTLEDFHARMLGQEQKVLNIILKADVQGSVDVFESSLSKLGNQEVSVCVVHSGVGGINESDVLLASASDAVILGFHVTANAKVQKMAEVEGVDMRTYRVIYEALDEVKHALEGLLTPDSREVITGHAQVRQVFRSSVLGNIAGCIQQDGETVRGGKIRIIRDGVVVHQGTIASVRREKEDVRSVKEGYECGIKIERFNDIQNGDVIESYRTEEVAKTLA